MTSSNNGLKVNVIKGASIEAITSSALSCLDSKNTAIEKATEASASATSASASESISIAKANEASASANSAIAQVSIATEQAEISATKASEASVSASSASASASTASLKANEASNSASYALISKTNAATSEANAFSYENSASTSAAIATTKASEASTSESNVANNTTIAIAKASEASVSASASEASYQNVLAYDILAEGYKDEALASAINAANSATSASLNANSANESAINASTSATLANTSAINASASASSVSTAVSNATAQAVIATTKANEASASAALAAEISGYDTVEDALVPKLNALAPYNGVIGTDTKQQQENLVFSTKVGNEYKLVDTSRFRKIDGKVFDTYGPELVTNGDFSNGTTGWTSQNATLSIEKGMIKVYSNVAIGSAVAALQHVTRTPGKKYLLSFSVISGNVNASVEIRQSEGTSTYSNLGNGNYSYIIGGATADYQIFFRPSTVAVGNYVYFDNISVKEVQTIDFSRSGQHPFEVYTNTALTVPNNVLAGDYVVVENENLITTPILATGWVDNGDDTYSTVSTTGYLQQSVLIVGQKYKFSFTIDSITSGGYRMYLGVSGAYSPLFTTVGTYTFTAIATVSSNLGLYALSATGTVSNISVKLADDTYRAKIDAPVGTALTNTTYFETRDWIGNQVFVGQKSDGTICKEVFLNDCYASESTNEIMLKNGWSKLEHGLYSKNNEIVSPIGYAQC